MIISETTKNLSNLSSNKYSVFDCGILYLPKIETESGNITVINNNIEIPFDTKRVFYLFDIPGGESRGAHAHRDCHQLLVAVSGSFEVLLDDGKTRKMVQLNRPFMALHILPGIWASEMNFSSGSICLVLASHKYDESDYFRDYKIYLDYKNGSPTL